jgi:predicted membrane channel-forming protein YqfA (hemolysin III family)
MNRNERRMEKPLRLSAIFVAVGLGIEALTLIKIHPLAFLTFMFGGGTCLAVGFIIYLYSLVSFGDPTLDGEGSRSQQPNS